MPKSGDKGAYSAEVAFEAPAADSSEGAGTGGSGAGAAGSSAGSGGAGAHDGHH
jgi:hypothetical protein